MKNFSQEIKKFIEEINWIFAKTYAKTWPDLLHGQLEKVISIEK